MARLSKAEQKKKADRERKAADRARKAADRERKKAENLCDVRFEVDIPVWDVIEGVADGEHKSVGDVLVELLVHPETGVPVVRREAAHATRECNQKTLRATIPTDLRAALGSHEPYMLPGDLIEVAVLNRCLTVGPRHQLVYVHPVGKAEYPTRMFAVPGGLRRHNPATFAYVGPVYDKYAVRMEMREQGRTSLGGGAPRPQRTAEDIAAERLSQVAIQAANDRASAAPSFVGVSNELRAHREQMAERKAAARLYDWED